MPPTYLPQHLVCLAWVRWHEGENTQDIANELAWRWDVTEAQVYNTLSLLRSHWAAAAGRAADPRVKRGAARTISVVSNQG